MTTYTQADIATRVLKDLGLIGAEETPSAADLLWAEETIASEVAMMRARGLVIWNGSDVALPVEYLAPLSRRIGIAASPSFGLMSTAQAEQAIPLAEMNLRAMSMTPSTGEVAEANYF